VNNLQITPGKLYKLSGDRHFDFFPRRQITYNGYTAAHGKTLKTGSILLCTKTRIKPSDQYPCPLLIVNFLYKNQQLETQMLSGYLCEFVLIS